MAGMIEQQMAGAMPGGIPGGMPGMEQMPEGMQAGMTEAMPGETEPDENNPAFRAALELAMKALYENQAASEVAEGLRSAPNPVEGMATTAYEITSVVDERTEGQVPDELIMLLGISVLNEVADIADAAGLQIRPADVAEAFKQMLLRFLGEQGLDTTQLQQALDQVDPALIEQQAQGMEIPA
jgi:hypothetical protein